MLFRSDRLADDHARARRLAEGLATLPGVTIDPATVEIGMPVRVTYIDFPEGDSGPAWTLYAWEPQA